MSETWTSGSSTDKHPQLTAAAPGHPDLVIQVQIIKSGGPLLAGGFEWLRELRKSQLWQIPEDVVETTGGLDLCVLKCELHSAIADRLKAVLEGGCGDDRLNWGQEGQLWEVDLGVQLQDVVQPRGICGDGLEHLQPSMLLGSASSPAQRWFTEKR